MPGSVWPDLRPPWAPQPIWKGGNVSCGCLAVWLRLWGSAAWDLHSASSARHWASLCPRSMRRLRQQIAVKSQRPSPEPQPSRISMKRTAAPSVMWDVPTGPGHLLMLHPVARIGRSRGLERGPRPGLGHCYRSQWSSLVVLSLSVIQCVSQQKRDKEPRWAWVYLGVELLFISVVFWCFLFYVRSHPFSIQM